MTTLNPKKDRKVRIRRIRRECAKITRLGRGRYSVKLALDHQFFTIWFSSEYATSKRRADFYATQLAIALNRFKFGD